MEESVKIGKSYTFIAFPELLELTEAVVKQKLGESGFKQYKAYDGKPVKVVTIDEDRADIKFIGTDQIVKNVSQHHLKM